MEGSRNGFDGTSHPHANFWAYTVVKLVVSHLMLENIFDNSLVAKILPFFLFSNQIREIRLHKIKHQKGWATPVTKSKRKLQQRFMKSFRE